VTVHRSSGQGADDGMLVELVDRLRAERATFERVLLRLPDVTAGLDPDRIRAGITELALDLVGGDFGLLVSVDEDEATGTWAGEEPALAPRVWRAPLLAAAFRQGPVLRIDDVGRWVRSEQAAAQYGTFDGGAMVRSYLVAPVADRVGEVFAALFIGHRRAHAFAAHHERLLEAMARLCATALENAERYHERARVASALEETLLPPLLPVIPGVDLGVRYRAAVTESMVGGDFYDVFRNADGWAALVGDVCGTGPEAAAVTGIARYTVRALAETATSPAETLVALNAALAQQRTERRFLTAVHLHLDEPAPDDGAVRVKLARAGHPPPVLVRADGTTTLLEEPRGMLLGVFDDVVVDEGEVELAPGDALVLYTDGVVEARGPDKEQYGYPRLQQLLSTCAGRTADGIARRVELAVSDFVGGGVDDDLAILVLRAL
jgi:serine phosphatase RsbU (regulator of sigma subunit)